MPHLLQKSEDVWRMLQDAAGYYFDVATEWNQKKWLWLYRRAPTCSERIPIRLCSVITSCVGLAFIQNVALGHSAVPWRSASKYFKIAPRCAFFGILYLCLNSVYKMGMIIPQPHRSVREIHFCFFFEFFTAYSSTVVEMNCTVLSVDFKWCAELCMWLEIEWRWPLRIIFQLPALAVC